MMSSTLWKNEKTKKRVNNKMLYVLLLQSSIKLKENVLIENETLLIDSCVPA